MNAVRESLMSMEGGEKAFGEERIFRGDNLRIWPGDLMVVLGKNGAGKTTLLRLLSGLLGLDAGAVQVDGETLDRFSTEQRRKFCFIPDFPVFLEELSCVENLGVYLNLYGREENVGERAMDLLERFGLVEKMKSAAGSLSRGQRYKLALVAMELVDPNVWLLDEPFASGMDPEGLSAFREIGKAAVERGRSVVYTTQLVDLAVRFSNRVCVIGGGGVSFDGPVADFRADVASGVEELQAYQSLSLSDEI